VEGKSTDHKIREKGVHNHETGARSGEASPLCVSHLHNPGPDTN
jgi:hypothetical protein